MMKKSDLRHLRFSPFLPAEFSKSTLIAEFHESGLVKVRRVTPLDGGRSKVWERNAPCSKRKQVDALFRVLEDLIGENPSRPVPPGLWKLLWVE